MLDEGVNQQEWSSSVPRVKETWFTGTHSDMCVLILRLQLVLIVASRGGGNVLNPDLDRSSAPLLWMSYEAISAGLLMKLSNVEWKWKRLGDVHESLTGVWKLFTLFT